VVRFSLDVVRYWMPGILTSTWHRAPINFLLSRLSCSRRGRMPPCSSICESL
jgi:hypothetical protein